MIVTEQEAKIKLCQEAIGPATAAEFIPPHRNCLGSACMAWRWFDNLTDQAIKQPRGYCGKAGRI